MKSKFFLCACFIAVTLLKANAQQTIDPKVGKAVAKAFNAGKILGRISYPKSFGVIINFIDKAKSNAGVFKGVNEQNVQAAIPFSKMTITEVTKANSTNYEFDFVIEGNFPFDTPINVAIKEFDYNVGSGGHDVFNFLKINPSESATFSLSDKSYEGFDFKSDTYHVVH